MERTAGDWTMEGVKPVTLMRLRTLRCAYLKANLHTLISENEYKALLICQAICDSIESGKVVSVPQE